MQVIKRDGVIVEFDPAKIKTAISKANAETMEMSEKQLERIAEKAVQHCEAQEKERLRVDDIQDIVEDVLLDSKFNHTAKAYIIYREERTKARGNITDKTFLEFLSGDSEYWNTENSNKDSKVVTCQRDYIAGIASTDFARRKLLPKDVCDAHDAGIIHQHDMDYMAQKALTNCCLVNLEDMLQNGTVINGVRIDPQNRLLTATTVATQIITAVASSQYGGTTITLTHLAPYVRKSYLGYVEDAKKELAAIADSSAKDELIRSIANKRIKREIRDAVQTFNYQINSMSTTNGQTPFLTVFLYLNENPEYIEEVAALMEEFLIQRVKGMKNEQGVYVTQAFPKLIYVLDENNIHEDSPYYNLTKLAGACSAERMLPDYISAKVEILNKFGVDHITGKVVKGFEDIFSKFMSINGFSQEEINEEIEKELSDEFVPSHAKGILTNPDARRNFLKVYPSMGCRSFLTIDRCTENYGKALNYKGPREKYYGRFNVGVTTINLADAALSSGGDFDKFWELIEERCELCHKGLQARIKRLETVTSDVAPILYQNGAFARLDKGEPIHELLHHGYCTASLGYAALYECVKYMTGHSHTDGAEGEAFGKQVMQKLNDMCAKWKAEEDIDYSVYGSPIESTTYKFAKSLKSRFGEDVFIKLDGKDRNYVTNSYHVPVFEEIDAFSKLALESKFQRLSPGGAISYIETANLKENPEAVMEVLKFIYDNIMYAELNTKSDYCQVCGYDGEMLIDENMEWYCPNCGNRDKSKMNVARRTCGYVGTKFWNKGRTEEIKERVIHLGEVE